MKRRLQTFSNMGFGDGKGDRRKREGEVRHHQSFMLSVKGEGGELIGYPL